MASTNVGSWDRHTWWQSKNRVIESEIHPGSEVTSQYTLKLYLVASVIRCFSYFLKSEIDFWILSGENLTKCEKFSLSNYIVHILQNARSCYIL